VQVNAWDARVRISVEDVVELPAQGGFHTLRGVHGHFASLDEIVRADVVEASNVVLVFVGKHHGVKVDHLVGEHLLPEIRTSVDADCAASSSEDSRSAQPLIVRVLRRAHRAGAADDGNALGRARAGEGEFDAHEAKVRLTAGKFGLKALTFTNDHGC
jgi:hypothetical protein